MKTRVEKDNCNPVWNEDLTIVIKDINAPITLVSPRCCTIHVHLMNDEYVLLKGVYDHDTFTGDDIMGRAEIHIKPLVECLKMGSEDLPDGTQLTRIEPSSDNWLSKESCIVWNNGKLLQPITLRLGGGGVECGQLQLQIEPNAT